MAQGPSYHANQQPNNASGHDLSANLNQLNLDGSSVTYSAWSRSYVEMYTVAHEWTIDNFIELDEESQVTFRVVIDNNEELRFKVSLKPKYGENREFISMYVHNQNKKELKYSLVFSVLNVNKEKKLSRRADTRVHSTNESWGFPKFCQRSDILDHASEYLPDGTLTVFFEIGGFKKITNRSDFQRVREKLGSQAYASPDLSSDLTAGYEAMEHTDCVLQCGADLPKASATSEEDEDLESQCSTAIEAACADPVTFPCHKFMLASRSDVFRAMFAHDMKESQQNKVIIEDSTPEVVQQFLKFVYTDTFDDKSFPTVSKLLPLAEKYNVRRLSLLCSQCLLQTMNEDNVSDIAVIGQIYNVSLLKNRAIEFISQYPEKVMKTNGWKNLLKQAPDVCTSIICRLSRVGCDRDFVIKTATKSNAGI